MITIYLGFNSKRQRKMACQIITVYFGSFTVLDALGFYKGTEVETIKIEILTENKTKVIRLAKKLKRVFKQKEVLVF